MLKTAVVVILCLSAGAVVGAFVAGARLGPRLAEASAQEEQLQKALAASKESAETARSAAARAERYDRENAALQEELAAAQKKPAGLKGAEWIQEALAARTEEAPSEAPREPGPAETEATLDRTPRGPGSQEDRQGRRNEDREGRDAARREWASQMRDSATAFMDAQIQAAPDDIARERLLALKDLSDGTMELMQQLRNAQTDEERDAVRQSLAEAFDTRRELLHEQQDYMLRQVAAQSGITAKEAQDQFVASVQETMSSPFFRGEGPMGFGGGPGRPARFGPRGGADAAP